MFTASVKQLIELLSVGVEMAAALIIAVAAIEATVKALLLFLRPHSPPSAKTGIRLTLGRWLAVALEFTLAADILNTAIAPTWDEIGKLAAIATIRTALNFFLSKEIENEARAEEQGSTVPTTEPQYRTGQPIRG